jgi:two-component system response regulator
MHRTGEILLVDDSEDDVVVALRAFRRHGLEHRVYVARDADEALRHLLAASPPPRVVLLDLRMPGVDGREVLRAVRADARTRWLPVVVVSSSNRPEDVQECYRLGANSYVTKQYGNQSPGDYLARVARYWLELNQETPVTRGLTG